jgi:hypothetical protein
MADPNRYFRLLQHPRVDESLKPDKLYVHAAPVVSRSTRLQLVVGTSILLYLIYRIIGRYCWHYHLDRELGLSRREFRRLFIKAREIRLQISVNTTDDGQPE